MQKQNFDGIEIEQKLMESLDIVEHFGFSGGRFKDLPFYENRERATEVLYQEYPHILVTPEDKVYGLKNGSYEFIQTAKGLYKQVENAGKI